MADPPGRGGGWVRPRALAPGSTVPRTAGLDATSVGSSAAGGRSLSGLSQDPGPRSGLGRGRANASAAVRRLADRLLPAQCLPGAVPARQATWLDHLDVRVRAARRLTGSYSIGAGLCGPGSPI